MVMMPKASHVYSKMKDKFGVDAVGIACLYRRMSHGLRSINRRHCTTIICIFAHLFKQADVCN